MIYFYFIVFVASANLLIADLLLRQTDRIKGFDLNPKLFPRYKPERYGLPEELESPEELDRRGTDDRELVPAAKFFPENVTMLLLTAAVGAGTGCLLILAAMPWYLSLPCAAAAGLIACFAAQYLVRNAAARVRRNVLPKGEDAAGLDGYCTVEIEAGGVGKARLFFRDREYPVHAAVYGDSPLSGIAAGEKVVAVYEEQGYYFVTRVDEIGIGV